MCLYARFMLCCCFCILRRRRRVVPYMFYITSRVIIVSYIHIHVQYGVCCEQASGRAVDNRS